MTDSYEADQAGQNALKLTREALALCYATPNPESTVFCTLPKDHEGPHRCNHATLDRAKEALAWYADHKRADGSYDGELFGDLNARVAAGCPPPESSQPE